MSPPEVPTPWNHLAFPSAEALQLRLLLRRIAIFEFLDDEESAYLLQRVDQRSFKAGDVLMVEGEPGDAFYVVAAGAFAVTKKRWGFWPRRIATRRQDEWIGEMALIEDAPRYATVTATESSEVYRIARTTFEEVLLRNPEAARLLRESANYRRSQDRDLGFS